MSAPGIFTPPPAVNEPIKSYAPGSPEREELKNRLREMEGERISLPLVIGGKDIVTDETFEAVLPHRKEHVLADVSKGGAEHVQQAIDAARAAHADWSRTPWHERAAVFLRASELLSGPWRQTLNAATMLNQSKTVHQAEIDAVCELIDFWRYNIEYLVRIYSEQPTSSTGTWNRMEYRPLEGFVFAVSPFNFTSIGGNLSSAPALMGNTDRVEARLDGLPWRALPHAPHASGGTSGRRDQPRARLRCDDRGGGAREPRARRNPLHRLDRRLQRDVEDRRHQRGLVPKLPASSSARQAARTSSSRIPPPMRRRSRPQWFEDRSSTRGRSARPPPACTSPPTCGPR